MGRHRRDLSASNWFHVNNRGSDRQDIFSGDQDRLLFEELFGDVAERFSVELHAYVLMSNHFHLVWHDPDGELSAAMQYLSAKYAMAYNRRTRRDGPLLTGRFHATPIVDDAQLRITGRYVHRNPLSFVPRAALPTYRWSSLPVLLDHRPPPPWLTTGVIRPLSEDVDEHRRFILTDLASDGVVGFDGRVRAIEFGDVVDVVAQVAGCAPATLASFQRGVGDPLRDLVVMIALEEHLVDPTIVAEQLGVSPSTVRRAARRGRVARAGDGAVSRLHATAIARLRDLERGRADLAA